MFHKASYSSFTCKVGYAFSKFQPPKAFYNKTRNPNTCLGSAPHEHECDGQHQQLLEEGHVQVPSQFRLAPAY